MVQYGIVKTIVGAFGFVAREKRLLATYLPEAEPQIRRRIRERWPDATENACLLPRFRQKVASYYAGKRTAFDEEADLSDQPPFRRMVLEQCRQIPYGKTASYQDLARAAGNPKAARAVGSTMAHNPLPLVVPCHRVLRADGTFGGFSSRSGVSEKKKMLSLEGALAV